MAYNTQVNLSSKVHFLQPIKRGSMTKQCSIFFVNNLILGHDSPVRGKVYRQTADTMYTCQKTVVHNHPVSIKVM